MKRNFREMIEVQWAKGDCVCVGLDSEFGKIPDSELRSGDECNISIANTVVAFNKSRMMATKDLVCAYKLNFAFYGEHGADGLSALRRTIDDIRIIAPDVPVILDIKCGDTANTNAHYARMVFEYLGADAITINPYPGGRETLQPFLDYKDKGIFVLCRTSNPDAGEFQDLEVRRRDHLSHLHPEDDRWEVMYRFVARCVASDWNKNGNCGLVFGATHPEGLAEVRWIVGDMPILITGIGVQGGDVEKAVKAGRDKRGQGMIITSSRGIIFARDPRGETLKLTNLINQCR